VSERPEVASTDFGALVCLGDRPLKGHFLDGMGVGGKKHRPDVPVLPRLMAKRPATMRPWTRSKSSSCPRSRRILPLGMPVSAAHDTTARSQTGKAALRRKSSSSVSQRTSWRLNDSRGRFTPSASAGLLKASPPRFAHRKRVLSETTSFRAAEDRVDEVRLAAEMGSDPVAARGHLTRRPPCLQPGPAGAVGSSGGSPLTSMRCAATRTSRSPITFDTCGGAWGARRRCSSSSRH